MKNLQKETWELKTLGEIATKVYSGDEIIKTQLNTGNYPAIKCGDINSGFKIYFEKCINFVNLDLIKNKRYFEYGDVLITNIGDRKQVGTAVTYLGNQKCLAGDSITIIKHSQNPKYLSYALSSEFCRNQVTQLAKSGTIFHIWNSGIKKIKVPLPSLDIQNKISNYLSKFTELIKELKETLIESKKQYSYYLNSLIGRSKEEVWLRN